MPYEIEKQERYSNFSGINTKVSRYVSGPQEVIRLVNYDFSRPGSFTKRPDTSEFLLPLFGPIRAQYEYAQQGGSLFFMVQSQGGTLSYEHGGAINGLTRMNPFFVSTPPGVSPVLYPANFVTANNNVWMGNIMSADDKPIFVRFGGPVGGILQLGQIPPVGGFYGTSWTDGDGATIWTSTSPVYFATLAAYRYRCAYVNDRDVAGTVNAERGDKVFANAGMTAIGLKVDIPKIYGHAYGMSYLIIYRDTYLGITTAAEAFLPGAASVTTAVFQVPIEASLPGVTLFLDSGASNATYLMGQTVAVYEPNEYYPLVNLGTLQGMIPEIVNKFYAVKDTGYPTMISYYNNMMFFAGFSKFPSHLAWSQLGTPEWVANDSFTEIRTNDGDVISCLIPYDGNLIVTKRTSIHVVNASGPKFEEISFSEKSDQYGFINPHSACVFQDTLWGIDGQGKGIVQFTGANLDIISDKVEDIFFRINLDAAQTEAFMLHVKSRNEVWCGIPVDGSEVVNTIIVYDYFSKAWTTFEGLSPTAIAIARGTLDLPAVVMGFSNGLIRNLNTVFSGEEGVTAVMRAPYITNYGWSATETYRRLFVDTDPILGASYSFLMNLYLDQGSTPSYYATFNVTSQQSRYEFGLPGKGMSVELIESSDNPLRVNGYTVGSRFQRNV